MSADQEELLSGNLTYVKNYRESLEEKAQEIVSALSEHRKKEDETKVDVEEFIHAKVI